MDIYAGRFLFAGLDFTKLSSVHGPKKASVKLCCWAKSFFSGEEHVFLNFSVPERTGSVCKSRRLDQQILKKMVQGLRSEISKIWNRKNAELVPGVGFRLNDPSPGTNSPFLRAQFLEISERKPWTIVLRIRWSKRRLL